MTHLLLDTINFTRSGICLSEESAPYDVIPLLILDSYRCHMMGLVVQKIQELGVEVKHIPGGCTSFRQPIDISFNKPFKDRLWKLWISWMISNGVIHGMTSTPTRLNDATWVHEAMKEMKRVRAMVRNAWLKTEYEWFNKNKGGLELIGGEEGLI
jgi:hypothetical protein